MILRLSPGAALGRAELHLPDIALALGHGE